ncbi:MAG: hypothetical protein AAF799_15360 [Myxococcota bacterium]
MNTSSAPQLDAVWLALEQKLDEEVAHPRWAAERPTWQRITMCVALVVLVFGAMAAFRASAGLAWPTTGLGVLTVGVAMLAVVVAVAGVLRPLHRTRRSRWHLVGVFVLLVAAVALELTPSRAVEHQTAHHSFVGCFSMGIAASAALVLAVGWFRRRPFVGWLDYAEVAGVGVAGGLLVLTAFCTSGEHEHVLLAHGLAALAALLCGAALARARNSVGGLR